MGNGELRIHNEGRACFASHAVVSSEFSVPHSPFRCHFAVDLSEVAARKQLTIVDRLFPPDLSAVFWAEADPLLAETIVNREKLYTNQPEQSSG
jgi:hypothetical protein